MKNLCSNRRKRRGSIRKRSRKIRWKMDRMTKRKKMKTRRTRVVVSRMLKVEWNHRNSQKSNLMERRGLRVVVLVKLLKKKCKSRRSSFQRRGNSRLRI
jgi:hypothetical protein